MSDILCYDGTTCKVSDEVQELRQQVKTLQDERQFMIDYVHAYAAYFNRTWWQLFDSPDASPLSFEAWITQEAEDWQ